MEIFTAEQDTNGNGIIDDYELTDGQKELKKKHKLNQRDLRFVFYTIYAFTLATITYMFIAFNKYGILLSVDVSKLANTLNVFIVIIGVAEGLRSFTKSATEDIAAPIPAYKLKILFWYLVSFCIMTVISIVFEFITKSKVKDLTDVVLPKYGTNEFIDGLASNVVAYLIARFGDKIAENIDLSSFKLFKKEK